MRSSSSHLGKELLDLIKSIGDCKSKQEEDKIITKDSEILKKKIVESNISPKAMKEYLIRAIYIEMLGHDASFSHLYAVNLTQDKNILNKRVGYLSCSLLLNENSEFLILLVASLQKDLQSQNWVEVSMALTTIIKFANPTIMQACTEPILKLLNDKNEQIRKKSIMCLYKFYQVSPETVPDCEEKMRKFLCDYDPSVMAATLPFFKENAKKNPEKYKNLVSCLVSILKKIIEHKLNREYDYHRFPAPWIQVIILEILSILGADDKNISENMYEVLGQCLRRADDTGINIGYAIVYQCLKTICIIYPNSHLIELASNTISRFLSSDSPNLRCTGINGLTLIIQINPSYVMTHQKIIVDCLEVNDETLKKNTFELLYKMTNLKNVEVIVEKMMNYLKHTTLENLSKKEILQKIIELTERFAPNRTWFINIMNDIFINFGDMITDEMLAKFIKIIHEWENETDDLNEFKKYTIENYATMVENYSVISESFVKLMAWIIGEYTCKLYYGDSEKIKGILQMTCYLLNKKYDDDITKCLLISAIAKINSNINFSEQSLVSDIMEKYSRDKNPELQQRCLEYKRTQLKNFPIERNEFTTLEDNLNIDINLSFLNNYVSQHSNNKIYNEEISENFMEKFSNIEEKLNVGPYASNENILSMPSKEGNFNNLYESKNSNLVSNMKNELSVKGAQKWGAEGYKDEKKKEEKKNVYSNTFNDFNNFQKPKYENTNNTKKNDKKREEELETNPDYIEKKKLMKGLFGGLDDSDNKQETKPKTKKNDKNKGNNNSNNNTGNMFTGMNTVSNNNSNNNNGMNLFEGMTTTNNSNNNSQKNNNNDLLGLGNENNNNNNGGNMDLLNLGNNQNNTFNNNNNNNQQSMDLFGDIFGTGNANNNVNNNFNAPQNNNQNNNNLFDNLNSANNKLSEYTPYNINTDTFGEIWENSPDEDSYEMNINISTPQQFHQIIKKGNFAAVDIINNEAISAANYKNQICLVHATVEINHVNLLVKCQNKSLNQEVANYVMGLFR